jgi:hypothetical protein
MMSHHQGKIVVGSRLKQQVIDIIEVLTQVTVLMLFLAMA